MKKLLLGPKHQYSLVIEESQKLGSGSFACVYKGLDLQDNQPVAIKVIDLNRASPRELKYLRQEIQTMSRLNHPNLVKLLFFQEERASGQLYLIMEYCAGGDLRRYLNKRGGRLSEATARHFLCQLAAGLQYLQEHRILHRDLKPHNLLLTRESDDAELKIADFGFAREFDPQELMESYLGSPLYMAPEILQRQRYTHKTDLWSVGVIFYEMLTGKPLFVDQVRTREDLIHKINTSPIEFPTHVSADALDLLKGLLAKKSSQRLDWENFFTHKYLQPQPSLPVVFAHLYPPTQSPLQVTQTSAAVPFPYLLPPTPQPQPQPLPQPPPPPSPSPSPQTFAPPTSPQALPEKRTDDANGQQVLGSTTWMQLILTLYPHGQLLTVYMHPDRLVSDVKRDVTQLTGVPPTEQLFLTNGGKELLDSLPLKHYKFHLKKKPIYFVWRSLLRASAPPPIDYTFNVPPPPEFILPQEMGLTPVTTADSPEERLRRKRYYELKVLHAKTISDTCKHRMLAIAEAIKQQDIQLKVFKVFRTYLLLQAAKLEESFSPLNELATTQLIPRSQHILTSFDEWMRKLSTLQLPSPLNTQHGNTLLDVVNESALRQTLNTLKTLFEQMRTQLENLRRELHESNTQVEESINRTLDATPLQNMNKYLDTAKNVSRTVKQLTQSLVTVSREELCRDEATTTVFATIDKTHQSLCEKERELAKLMHSCAEAKTLAERALIKATNRMGVVLSRVQTLHNSVTQFQQTVVTIEGHITSLEPYATLADDYSHFLTELRRRRDYQLKVQQCVARTRAYFQTQRDEELIRRQTFRQLHVHPDSATYRLLSQLMPALIRDSSLPLCEITLPPFDVDLPPVEPTQLPPNELTDEDDFSIIADSKDPAKKVIELEKEKAELLSKLNTLLARQQQQEAPQNQQSTDSNASGVLLVKRISDLENELNATRETLATVTAELQQFRQQPTLQHEYTALSAQYQQLETANRDLRNEVDRLQKQLAQLQQNTQQPQQQTSDEVKEIEELRRQLKLSTELIEQLLMEQTKSEQRVHAAERRLKELQQELDTLRQHRKQ